MVARARGDAMFRGGAPSAESTHLQAAVAELGDESSWTTGQTIVLDGGVTLTGGV